MNRLTNIAFAENVACPSVSYSTAPDLSRLRQLKNENTAETLAFLALRPVHTVVMSSFIHDNGLESPLHRGQFYGFRNRAGQLEGVALIGHATLVEARTEEALQAFAGAAQHPATPIHLIMSDGPAANAFWKCYAGATRQPRLVCEELLFEVSFPFLVQQGNRAVRPARADELEQVAQAHAEVAFAESGVDPMMKDRAGFLRRALRRIEQGRTFVVFDEAGKLVFKADIAAATGDVVYLEGIYVAPEYRGQNVGSQCLGQLNLQLLERAQHICLLSNAEHEAATRCFVKAGYKNTDSCVTIFV